MYVLYSTLLHLPPLGWHRGRRMLGSNPGQLRPRHWLSDALATRLHLIHIRLHLIHRSATSRPRSATSHPRIVRVIARFFTIRIGWERFQHLAPNSRFYRSVCILLPNSRVYVFNFIKGGRANVFLSPQIANLQILGLNPQSQIRKFPRYASPQILIPQIFRHKRQREWNIYL
jgi:hypothetical protein